LTLTRIVMVGTFMENTPVARLREHGVDALAYPGGAAD